MRKVADYIGSNLHEVLSLSALEIAARTETSDASVIRTVQALGFSGLRDLKLAIEGYFSKATSPTVKMASTTGELASDIDTAIDFMINDQHHAMEQLGSERNRRAMQDAITILSDAKAIGVFGIGASGVISSYTSRLFARSGFPSYELNRTGISLAEQLIQMEEGHALVMLGHARIHNEARATIEEAEKLGIPIVVITTAENSPLSRHAKTSITLPRSKSDHVALHAPLMCCAETIMLGLAARNSEKTIKTLDRMVHLRNRIRPSK